MHWAAESLTLLRALRADGPAITAIRWSVIMASLALVLHAIAIGLTIYGAEGLRFGLFNTASLVFLLMVLITHVLGLWQPVGTLLLVFYPLAVLSLLAALLMDGRLPAEQPGWELGMHVGLSILAYSLLTIAAIQAGAVAVLNRELKRRHTHGLIEIMPPLQTMERMLFQLIWAGELLLTLAIASGAIFLEDLFAPGMAHKTILSIVAWGMFAVLLWGRHWMGWRGRIAIRWTVAGFMMLILAYFGSRFVLEFLLQRA